VDDSPSKINDEDELGIGNLGQVLCLLCDNDKEALIFWCEYSAATCYAYG